MKRDRAIKRETGKDAEVVLCLLIAVLCPGSQRMHESSVCMNIEHFR